MKTTTLKLTELIPDAMNANKHTQRGQHLVEKSLRELGAGRSILLDKNKGGEIPLLFITG
jgi:hypothetical protein